MNVTITNLTSCGQTNAPHVFESVDYSRTLCTIVCNIICVVILFVVAGRIAPQEQNVTSMACSLSVSVVMKYKLAYIWRPFLNTNVQ